MISRATIDTVFDTARVEEVIGDFVQLKKSGSNFKGLSPFSEERTPSFMVSPVKQIWKDFSSGKGGNVAFIFIIAMPPKLGLTIAFNGSPSKCACFYWHENRANRFHERSRFQVVMRVEFKLFKILINHSAWPLQRSKN